MPRYGGDIRYIVEREDVLRMFDYIKKARDRAIVSFLYLTGARPSEVVEIMRDDITVEPHRLIIRIPTKKLRQGDFEVEKRELIIPRPYPRDAIDTELVTYVESVPYGSRLFPVTTDHILKMIKKASEEALGFRLVPYNFRHSRLTKLARAGATIETLQYWKGARSLKSIAPYLHGRPVEAPPEWVK